MQVLYAPAISRESRFSLSSRQLSVMQSLRTLITYYELTHTGVPLMQNGAEGVPSMIHDIFAVAAETDDELRLKIVAKTLQKYLNLPGLIITRKPERAQVHELVYAAGYN